MKSRFTQNLAEALSGIIGNQNQLNSNQQEYLETIDRAINDMKLAERYFQSVSDPDLVDHAIYQLEAARKKYIYLLKHARENGINLGDNCQETSV